MTLEWHLALLLLLVYKRTECRLLILSLDLWGQSAQYFLSFFLPNWFNALKDACLHRACMSCSDYYVWERSSQEIMSSCIWLRRLAGVASKGSVCARHRVTMKMCMLWILDPNPILGEPGPAPDCSDLSPPTWRQYNFQHWGCSGGSPQGKGMQFPFASGWARTPEPSAAHSTGILTCLFQYKLELGLKKFPFPAAQRLCFYPFILWREPPSGLLVEPHDWDYFGGSVFPFAWLLQLRLQS